MWCACKEDQRVKKKRAIMKDVEIVIPKLYEDLETVVLVEWYKKEGDFVKVGEIIFNVETDKAVFEIESEYEGYLKRIIVNNGTNVNVMDVVGVISSGKD